ncbi:peptidylprolyl isomerase [Candidatus Nitrotoga fabula]|uniref:Chaperone SurA n=1 Tax=Candidatus Nitrotoga fabula TaxID=2182327 RepID=A0A916BDB5_9PROT|nr:peptidylprolyl isomerase [Candidatus Nitrotoga fabula]CAE6692060.1 Chaperone SurA [Candidatus Nitrotoga fabula]
MPYIQLLLASLFSVTCIAPLSAADLQNPGGSTPKQAVVAPKQAETAPKKTGSQKLVVKPPVARTKTALAGKSKASSRSVSASGLKKASLPSKKKSPVAPRKKAAAKPASPDADLKKTAATASNPENPEKDTGPMTTAAPAADPSPPDSSSTVPDSASLPHPDEAVAPAIATPAVVARPPRKSRRSTTSGDSELIDEIVAVVNNDAITRYELEERIALAENQLSKQGTPLPDTDLLEKQVLERMITEMLQVQFAKDTGIRVDDVQLDKALQRMAKDNKFTSLGDFRAQLEKEGIVFRKFREDIRSEIIFARLREREVDSKLIISDGEVENYLANQAKQAGKGEEFHLAHILIMVPEQASAEKIQEIRKQAEQALAQLQGGADFAQVAAGFSDAKDALEGGNLGWRPADRIPAIFLNVLEKIGPGGISPIFRSPNGFHILKLIEKRSKEQPVVISQAHVRHILIKTSELVPEAEAKSRLMAVKERIGKGADFAKEAKLHSEDGSAMQGGDLGWISPGETVPEFEKAMNELEPGQISDLVQSTFGWHLIQVLERRDTDVSLKQKKQQAQMAIRSYKSETAYQDWLRQLRDSATIENRLEKSENTAK